ncbi:hypothetical protein Ah1_00295 [Aeromonas phage Ah1]|uniref:Uncharacterized protein n=1 Tax=Aeromonas phage Ah1 TaxID=2053701 RepID=A0A2H4YF83_9CAUD|nr:hypothetical protein KNT77_gp223 [Aeromonas phage Ah1]AUE22813.1 hypothetical protein Ah1_00295 [Aeromonas phage Ah1]
MAEYKYVPWKHRHTWREPTPAMQNREHQADAIKCRLESLVEFMNALGFDVANGQPWRGFKRGNQQISFYIAKNMMDFACIDGSFMYRFASQTPNLVIINEFVLTGKNREYKFPKAVWNNAVRTKRSFLGCGDILVDKKNRCLFTEHAFYQYGSDSEHINKQD